MLVERDREVLVSIGWSRPVARLPGSRIMKSRLLESREAFDQSAGISSVDDASRIGYPTRGSIWLTVNGEMRQKADIADLIWSVPEVIAIP